VCLSEFSISLRNVGSWFLLFFMKRGSWSTQKNPKKSKLDSTDNQRTRVLQRSKTENFLAKKITQILKSGCLALGL
jgi:hypothetical protein